MILTITQIEQKCKIWAREIWGIDFNIPVEVSGRMTTTLGFFRYRTLNSKIIPIKLQFSKNLLAGDYKIDTVDSVILHELCHWALSQLNKPFNDGHPEFEAELKRIGASSTKTIFHAGIVYDLKCSCCGKVVSSNKSESQAKKYTKPKYVSKCCRSRLIIGNAIKKEDTFVRTEAKCVEIENSIKNLQEKQGYIIPSPIQKSENVNSEIKITINDIFNTNEKMTNAKMEVLLKDLIIKGEAEKIRILKDTYEITFNRALRYLGSKRNEQIIKLIG